MTKFSDRFEKIAAGEKATIENIHREVLSISLINDSGCELEIELRPGQVVGFSAGSSDAKVVLHHGDPSGLLIIKPELAS